MSRKTLRMVLVELKSIRTTDIFVADAIKTCIALIESDLNPGNLPPHQRHSETSREAAAEIAPKFGRTTRAVLIALSRHADGLTDEEGQSVMRMDGNSYRPCRVTLANKGLVKDTGQRRMTAHRKKAAVWAVTPAGADFLREEGGR